MTTQSNLPGKTALVTGGSRGIGRATALALGQAGAQVIVHYGSAEKEAAAVVAEIRNAGGKAEKVAADLRAADGPHLLAERVRAIIGDRLDILVANAGIAKAASIAETTVEDFDALFAVNVRAPYFLVQQLLPVMRKGSSVIRRDRRCDHLPRVRPGPVDHRRHAARRRRFEAVDPENHFSFGYLEKPHERQHPQTVSIGRLTQFAAGAHLPR